MNDDSPRPSLQIASPFNSACDTPLKKSKAPHTQHLISTLVRESKWKSAPSFDYDTLIENCLSAVLNAIAKQENSQPKNFELSVLLTNDAEIQDLNKEYRQKDTPTNVLSFESGYSLDLQKGDQAPAPIPLGDLVLSYETLKKEAEFQHKSFQDHLTHLLIHGLLHLFGFDHEDESEADEMEHLEINILDKEFHIKSPYTVRG